MPDAVPTANTRALSTADKVVASTSAAAMPIDGSEEDFLLSRSEYLTRDEVIRRRSRRLKQLIRIYKDCYWSLMEDVKVNYRDYYWDFGKSPYEDEDERDHDHDTNDNDDLGLGLKNNDNGGGQCAVHGCKSKAMALTKFCHNHILSDAKQKLYIGCNYVIKRGIWHALQTISREEGFFGLYKGLGATLLGVGPNLAISFSVYDTTRSTGKYRDHKTLLFWLPLLVAVFRALHHQQRSRVRCWLSSKHLTRLTPRVRTPDKFSWHVEDFSKEINRTTCLLFVLVTFPLDLMRRRKQLEGAAGRARVYNTGLFGTFVHIFRAEGLCGLYRGILPEYYKVVPSVGIVFMTYEKLKQVLSNMPDC